MDALAEKVERYLADHKAVFTIDGLAKRLKIRKRKLLLIVGELKGLGHIDVRYANDKMLICHTIWVYLHKKYFTRNTAIQEIVK